MKRKVLIIDDSDEVLLLLHEIIRLKFGQSPLCASSVEQAFKIIHQEKENLAAIVCDFAMPGGGGLSVRAMLIKHDYQVPFFLHSAMPDAEQTFEACGLPIDAAIPKCDQMAITEELTKVLFPPRVGVGR